MGKAGRQAEGGAHPTVGAGPRAEGRGYGQGRDQIGGVVSVDMRRGHMRRGGAPGEG